MALAFIRVTDLTVNSMEVVFNDDLDPNIGVSNVSVVAELPSIPNPEVISLEIENASVFVGFRALFPNVQYKVTFLSTDSQFFQSVNGNIIAEDGNRNQFFITSPGEDENIIRDEMLEGLSIIYEVGEASLVRDIVTTNANYFQKTVDDIGTTAAANYLSVLVEDELVTRDDGPIDRLSNGGAFEILRVSSNPTGTSQATFTLFDDSRLLSFNTADGTIVNDVIGTITADPISLQAIDILNESVSDDIQLNNHFLGLTVKVSNRPVIQVISLTLVRGATRIAYDVERFGYALKDNRYNTQSASINVNLADNEIELSSASLTGQEGGFELPKAGDEIRISYIHKRLGRDIDPDTVTLTRSRNTVRANVPAIVTSFALDNAPIITSEDEIAAKNGVEFLSTQATDGALAFTVTHPAFTREIPFDITKLPAKIGEYSINYESGEVFVFGTDELNQGTGDIPPVATYTYRQSFIPNLDFTFNSDRDEIAASSVRSIPGIQAKVSFGFEDNFAQDEDFRTLSHVESLNERVNNKLIDAFKILTDRFPVTNVFRILNETTGELYTPLRFNDTSITFNGRQAPRQRDIDREKVFFSRVPQEVLLISDELTNSGSLTIFKVNLLNSGLTDSQGMFIGSNFDTSVIFSETSLFLREFFYEDKLFTSVSTNLNRLEQVGDYSIDYNNGIVYVAVSATQNSDVGDISYQHKKIETVNKHILGVNNIYRSSDPLVPNTKTYIIGDRTDTTADPLGLEQIGERFINSNSVRPLLIGSYQSGEDGVTGAGGSSFVSFSAVFTLDDIGKTLRVGDSSSPPAKDVTITGIISDHEALVTPAFDVTLNGRPWVILDLSSGASKTITVEHDIVSVSNIYTVTQLGQLPAAELDGYFDINRDSISGNVITLGATNPLEIGTAIVVVYNYGNVFIDYRHVQDELVISYEYGQNSLDWSISDTLSTAEEYFVTYKYGALRDSLLTNFGALTQIPQLTSFSPNLDREIYRDIVGGTLQSFIEGPTIPSIERLVEAFTDVTPNIKEAAFSNWVLGRDFLHLREMETSSGITFDLGKFNNGAVINDDHYMKVPALAHLRLDEGTFEAWVRPGWKGLGNDSVLTFNSLTIDGYSDAAKVFIGFTAESPASFPFDLSVAGTEIPALGQPNNIDDDTGFFIWFDEFIDAWQIRWRENRNDVHEFDGNITTSGEFFNVQRPLGPDGYEINEVTDVITSTIKQIKFNAFIDGYDAASNTTTYALDGISFASDDEHYLFDMASRPDANRMSIFKDGTGYLNFQVFDNGVSLGHDAGFYNISYNVRDWLPNELHHIAASWRLNSIDEMDELHLFVDGNEVPNLFKYGGNPKASSTFDFGDVSEETVISSASRPIVGGIDGLTEAGSVIFRSLDVDFEALGVLPGDKFYILDDTPDGIGDPNFGLFYTVVGVGGNNLSVDRPFTLTLGDINFSVNQITATVETEINFQEFMVVSVDADGTESELNGVAADDPDYTIRRGGSHTHVITINDGVGLGEAVLIKPLGLIFRRCRERLFVYGDTDEIRLNGAPPVSLDDVKITGIILPRTLIDTGGGFGLVGTVIGAQLVTLLQSFFADPCQPSNSEAGRKLAITLSGDNINYTIPGNQVIISGTTVSGVTQETLLFTENDKAVTSEYWKTIDSIVVSVIPIDATQAVGIIEVRENLPLTVSENNGDFAEVVDFSNGIIKLETFGTGGLPFILNRCLYEVDYPSFLRIEYNNMPDTFFIGSDFAGEKQFDGVIDEVRILDTLSEDTRIGETLGTQDRSITTDFNAPDPFVQNSNTLFLSSLDNEIDDESVFTDRYNRGFRTAPSINDDFGESVVFDNSLPFIIDNASPVFNNNEGTIEFWVSPMDDSVGDPNFHFYVDMSAVVVERLESVTTLNVITTQRIREVDSVRLETDVFDTGTNFFTGGSVSVIDGKTITLGTPLPEQNAAVKVAYVPLGTQGDRVSIYKDPSGFVNFFMKAKGIEHKISVHVDWKRHTWHRVMVMWQTNSINNQDRLRLFVDGNERGTIRYGTGLLYGTGVVYGQAEVRAGVNRFLVDNIDLTDTFSNIVIGTDVFKLRSARSRLDNIRFSEVQRLQAIKVTTTDTIDINYNANLDLVAPVVEDLDTTRLLNFDQTVEAVEFLATIINTERGIFRFEVEVIDSFDKVIGNTQLETLLKELINTIKPAHTEAIITFLE